MYINLGIEMLHKSLLNNNNIIKLIINKLRKIINAFKNPTAIVFFIRVKYCTITSGMQILFYTVYTLIYLLLKYV